MKRWGSVLVAIVAIVVTYVLIHGAVARRKTDPHPVSVVAPAESQKPVGRAVYPENHINQPAMPNAGAPKEFDGAQWKFKTRQRLDGVATQRAIVAAEIEAVAPRLHLSAGDTQKLIRWHDRLADLQTSLFGSVTNDTEYTAAEAKTYAAGRAMLKAEGRLLGGAERWNDYAQLRQAFTNGYLNKVDDHGNFPVTDSGVKDEVIYSSHGRGPVVDTSPYDFMFVD